MFIKLYRIILAVWIVWKQFPFVAHSWGYLKRIGLQPVLEDMETEMTDSWLASEYSLEILWSRLQLQGAWANLVGIYWYCALQGKVLKLGIAINMEPIKRYWRGWNSWNFDLNTGNSTNDGSWQYWIFLFFWKRNRHFHYSMHPSQAKGHWTTKTTQIQSD